MLGALIGAGANLLGGWINSKSADRANEASERMAAQNIAQQREFAQHGLTWKIDDAFRNADRVHPIYSLGASGPSFTPVSANFTADTSLGQGVAAAGQDIGRAINATATNRQRTDAFTVAAQKLSLEKGSLENELLRSELASKNARLRQVAMPPFPNPSAQYAIPGQGATEFTKPTPLETVPGVPGQPQSEGGAITDVGYARTATGWAPVPSKDVKERIEDDFIQQTLHSMRNNVMPSFGMNFSPPPFEAPPGKESHFHVPSQEYRLQPKGQGWWDRGFTVRDERKSKWRDGAKGGGW